MRKILAALLAAVPLAASAAESAPAETLARAVFQVRTYRYVAEDKNWEAVSRGSATLLPDGRLLTNAHVVRGDDGNPTGAYLACRADDWREAPKCLWQAKAVRVDAAADLALLEPADAGKPWGSSGSVSVSETGATLGDAVRAVGYPANGGRSVTVTEGKVVGQDPDSGWLKIDANLDAGNSGGAAFDASGSFVGVPTAVSEGYTTLGYLVPAATAKKFLASGPEVSFPAVEKSFAKRLAAERALASGPIASDGLSLPDPRAYGFVLAGAAFTEDGAAARYEFARLDGGKTDVAVSRAGGAGESPESSFRERVDALRADYGKVGTAKNLRLGKLKVRSAVVAAAPSSPDEDASSFGIVLDFGGGVAAQVTGSTGDLAALADAVKFLSALSLPARGDWKEIRLGGVSAPVPSGAAYRAALDADGTLSRSLALERSGRPVSAEITLSSAESRFAGTAAQFVAKVSARMSAAGSPLEWAGLRRAGDGTPYLRFGYWTADRSKNVQEMLFSWKGAGAGAGANSYAFVRFFAKSRADAIAAADAFAASAKCTGAFALDASGLAPETNLATK